MLKKTPLYEDIALQDYVTSIGQRIAKVAPPSNIQFRFAVLDNEGVMAYSVADGRIVVSRGTLMHLNSETELAAVIAHEIGHVIGLHQSHIFEQADRASALHERLSARFTSERARELLGTLSLAHVRGYGREQEVEADDFGEQLLLRAGYDPVSAARSLNFLLQYDDFAGKVGVRLSVLPDTDFGGGVFATHPSSKARLDLAMKRLRIKQIVPIAPERSYLQSIEGLPYGVAKRYGVQRDALFVSADRHIAFTVPKDWYVFGSDNEIIAAMQDLRAMARFSFASATMDETVRDALRRRTRFDHTDGPPLSIHADRGKMVTLLDTNGAPAAFDAVVDVGEHRIYFRGMTVDAKSFTDLRETLLTIIQSLRTPTTIELEWEPARVHAAEVRQTGPVIPSQVLTDHPQENSELLNQLFPNGKVSAGQWIKVVR